MNITKDDPLLTAYALGEVTDEERAAVERFLEKNPDARAEVEEIRAAATLLTGALAEEDAPALTPEQRAAVLEAAEPAPIRAPVRAPFRHGRLVLRLAFYTGLIVAIGAVLIPPLTRTRGGARGSYVARTTPGTDASAVSREEEAPAQPALVDQLAEPREFDNHRLWGEDFRSMYPPDATQPAVGEKEQPEFTAQPTQQNIRAEFTDKPGAFVEIDEGSATGEAPKGDTPAAAPLPQVEYATGNLQNVEIGGKLRIADTPLSAPAAPPAFVEQRSQLNVKADFTDKVEAFVEADESDSWGVPASNEAKAQSAAPAAQVPAEVRDQLQALGYLSPKDGLDRRFYWNRPVPAPG
ncbi:MAG TPA: hypothetical protein PKL54_03915, partial [Candidatus Hydrogenedentes bacterium]|nr:hypothetical protein [Candidatus Hydrogenedentota bacterium]